MSVSHPRGLRSAAMLALVASFGFAVKVGFLAAVGTDATWKDSVAGTAYLVGTLALLTAVALAVWTSWRGGTASRLAVTVGAVFGVLVLQGVVDEIGIATLDEALADVVQFETSMVVSALVALALWWTVRPTRKRS